MTNKTETKKEIYCFVDSDGNFLRTSFEKKGEGNLVLSTPENSNQKYDFDKEAWVDIPVDYENLAKYTRDSKIYGGVEVDGIKIKTDINSVTALNKAAVRAKEDNSLTVDWKTEDGWVQLDSEKLILLDTFVFNHVQKCFTVEKNIDYSKIKSKEDLEAEFNKQYGAL